jgi:sugar/nucleoside kinase (ribokinase family)
MNLTPGEMLQYLRSRGCKIGAVTLGANGMVWYDEGGQDRVMPALNVPSERVIDTNGAGDIFHGAYIYSAITSPDTPWESHFRFARAASAHAVQHLGNEASLPTLSDINETQAKFAEGYPLPFGKLAVSGMLQGKKPAMAKKRDRAHASDV